MNDSLDRIRDLIRQRIDREHDMHHNGFHSPTPSALRARMRQDSENLSRLDAKVDAAGNKVGSKPPVPPTWRGRFGSWAIDLLSRLLWWHIEPVRRTFEFISRRNREQTITHAQLQEQVLSLLESFEETRERVDRLEDLRHTFEDYRSAADAAAEEFRRDLERRHAALESHMIGVTRLVSNLERVVENVTRYIEDTGPEQMCSGRLSMQVEQLREALREVRLCNEAAETRRTELAQRVSDAAHAVWGRLPMLEMQLESASRDHQRLQTELSSHNSELKGRLAELETRSSVSDSLRMELAERASQALHSLSDRLSAMEKVPHRRAETGGTLAELYAEFEDIFRGPTEQIKQRLQVYIPLLRDAQLGSPDAAVLDLGCGRGEWIQLLTGHGFSARGIDRNPVMVRRCVDIGLQVSEADALTHLRSLPPASLGAITSFHMIEHLPFETVLAIVDEALRALRPGGLLILETPNPHNLMVGAETFWIDPTHLHPIPSQTLRFFVEARGFRQVEIWDLQPYPEAERLPHAPGLAEWVNQRFYGPRDYSVIGRRP